MCNVLTFQFVGHYSKVSTFVILTMLTALKKKVRFSTSLVFSIEARVQMTLERIWSIIDQVLQLRVHGHKKGNIPSPTKCWNPLRFYFSLKSLLIIFVMRTFLLNWNRMPSRNKCPQTFWPQCTVCPQLLFNSNYKLQKSPILGLSRTVWVCQITCWPTLAASQEKKTMLMLEMLELEK